MRLLLGSLVALGLLACSAVPAFAAPANDNFSAAQDLGTLPSTVAATTVDAATESGEPVVFTGPNDKTVWFKWTASSTGPVHLDVCNDNGFGDGLRFAVYTGTEFANLEVVAKNSFWAGEDCAQTFSAEGGVTYYVAVASWPNGQEFNLTLRTAHPPANDDFANAQTIGPSFPVHFSGTVLDATAEPGEPLHEYHAAPTKSVWYRWVAPRNTEATFQRDCTTDEARTIDIYTGTHLSDLTYVVSTVCFVTIDVSEGETYWIAANAMTEGGFDFDITAPTPPANDDFGSAQRLPSGLPSSALGSNINATWQNDEPDPVPDVPALLSVWYRWTATTSGPVRIDTCDSEFDTLLAVFSGSSLSGLTAIAGNDDGGICDPENPFGSAVEINAQAGQEYRIAVDGYDAGQFRIDLTAAGPQTGGPVTGVTPPAPKKHKKHCGKKHKRHKKKCRKKRS
jgi:hypothetical protein